MNHFVKLTDLDSGLPLLVNISPKKVGEYTVIRMGDRFFDVDVIRRVKSFPVERSETIEEIEAKLKTLSEQTND